MSPFSRRIQQSIRATSGAANQAPSAPSNLVITPAQTSLALSWTAATDSDGTIASYQVRVNGVLDGSTASTTYNVTGLTASTAYTITVRAVDNIGLAGSDVTGIGTTSAAGVPSSITHGEELTIAMTGYVALGVTQGQLSVPTVPGEGYWRIDAPQWGNWPAPGFATGTYVYNDLSSNHGGYVPAGGMMIDGFSYPAGTYVIQFMNLSSSFAVTDANFPILMRGCRIRGTNLAPGTLNVNSTYTGSGIGFHYCDAGGLGAADAQYNEIPFKLNNANWGRAYRNYVSYTTTGIQMGLTGSIEMIENYIERLTEFYGPNPPPGESTNKHLNGITFNGGENCALVLRNHIIAQSPDEQGRTVSQTDCISFFQDFGTFPGTGTNADATTGYQVRDNYVGGTGFCFYAGKNAGSAANSVNNMVITGNKVTTTWWPNGGSLGPIAAEPAWGTLGNVKSNNTWADGPNAGSII